MPEDDSIAESQSRRLHSDSVPKEISDEEEGKMFSLTKEEDGVLYMGKYSYIVKKVSSDNASITNMMKSYQKTSTTSAETSESTLTPEQKAIFDENNEMKLKLQRWNRFSGTVDVIISKLFPAGFFWQLAASLCGLPSETLGFAICTGIGEAIGVVTGHILFSLVKSGGTSSFAEISQTAIFLGTGTICSGTSWQPIVNTLQGIGLSFLGVFVGTWIACTYMFNFGLRAGRNLYSKAFEHVEGPTWENSRTDFLLSFTIGGATAFFVGTDTAYLPEQNFLIGIVGIHDSFSIVHGAVLAGVSTALGFGFTQTIFNVVFPPGKSWND
eukprot:CAMPEP_0203672278 /NCGR_PEP_ID=MMETSP0090-20130426/8046_1 /ASSEMBLY_ACC=CAM_ASM_001088 /TAXON_ID=426623 /ORGANISM="Chaetoceros affinis, Strain CCMP159" /LENGTH=325 /DNA_ID=CAMNT_0050537563 /DNA_START=190 /DNA_END=1167 /DNA_ORIENTATION=+